MSLKIIEHYIENHQTFKILILFTIPITLQCRVSKEKIFSSYTKSNIQSIERFKPIKVLNRIRLAKCKCSLYNFKNGT